jgi:hypothetical protein
MVVREAQQITSSKLIRVVLADDEEALRRISRRPLGLVPGLEVVGEAADVRILASSCTAAGRAR